MTEDYVCTLLAKRIPRGWVIDRKCRNPRCYDPKHMQTVPPNDRGGDAYE
jgi:hypothetical protein